MKILKKSLALLIALFMLLPSFAFFSCETGSAPSLDVEQSETLLPDEDAPTQPPADSSPPESYEPPVVSTPDPVPEPDPDPEPVVLKADYLRCTADSVNIRSGAGTNYSVLGSAEKGTRYAIMGKSNGWYKTYYRNKIAYISASYAGVFSIEKSDNDDVEDVIEEGYKLIGVPYVYGAVRIHDGKGKLLAGFSAQKFDCSSLVQYVFYKGANKLLNVNTRTQVKQGKYVAKKDLQRGDCIFFTNESRQYNTGVERIGHVAIYLGDNYILHTASDYARIEQISAQRWKFYVEARRFL